MIAQLFSRLTKFPWFRRFVFKRMYNRMAKMFPTEEWTFMNYGYAYDNDEDSLTLKQEDEINRYSIQLYHSTISQVENHSGNILEVGSGRGGGANYIANTFPDASVTGMDIAGKAVTWCNSRYHNNNLKYVEGNSENMPFENESFDIVVNIESSHAYGSVDYFLSEVNRVLSNSGYFLLSDFRDQEGLNELKKQFADSGLKLVSENDITQNVLKAMEEDDKVKRQRIQNHIPGWISKLFGEFAGVIGSNVYNRFNSRELRYYQFVLQKN